MKYIFSILLFFLVLNGYAQKNTLFFSPLRLVDHTLDLEYRRDIYKKLFFSVKTGATSGYAAEEKGKLVSTSLSGTFWGVGLGVKSNIIDSNIWKSYFALEFINSNYYRRDIAEISGFYGTEQFIFFNNYTDYGCSINFGHMIKLYKNFDVDVNARLMVYSVNISPINYFYSPGFGTDFNNEGDDIGTKLSIFARLAYSF